MAKHQLPSPDLLRQLLRYEPETGKLFWRERPESMFKRPCMAASWNKKFAGTEALSTPKEKGYLHGTILGRRYRAHRVIVAMETGAWPDQVDHDNRKTNDNRWPNLKPVGSFEQARNKKLRRDNTSGHVGVHFDDKHQRWRARIDNRHIGTFSTLDEALAARKAAEGSDYHPNHGKR